MSEPGDDKVAQLLAAFLLAPKWKQDIVMAQVNGIVAARNGATDLEAGDDPEPRAPRRASRAAR